MSGSSKEKATAVHSSPPTSPAGEMPEMKDSRRLKSESPAAGLNDRWLVPGVCIFLAAIIWVVFGQTLRHEFVNYDDDLYVYENPTVTRGLSLKGVEWAFTHSVVCQLASADDDVPHAGLPVVWIECRRTSFDQCPSPYGNGDPAVSGAAADDGVPVAQRVCGGGVCDSSVAGGIGGVGGGTQGCAQRTVFHADALGVHALCGK